MVSCASLSLSQACIKKKIICNLVDHEEGLNSQNSSFSLSLSWHCTSRVRAGWKSHMAGDKARAGIVCILCRASGTTPLHLKGSSGLAESSHACMSSTAQFT